MVASEAYQKKSSQFLSKFKNDAQCMQKEVIAEITDCQIVSKEEFARETSASSSGKVDSSDLTPEQPPNI